MEPLDHVKHCPRCGLAQAGRPAGPFRCAACGFVLYVNPAAAVAALVVRADGRALFVRRAKEPARGQLAMPGGFVDEGEGAEEALRREVREETGLVLDGLEYLSSHPNRYPYAGVTYHTVDLFFVGRTDEPERAAALDQVDDVVWLDPFEVPLADLAFESMRAALAVYRGRYLRPREG